MTIKFPSERVRENWNKLQPSVREEFERVLNKPGFPNVRISSAWRAPDEQFSPSKTGSHPSGQAIDLQLVGARGEVLRSSADCAQLSYLIYKQTESTTGSSPEVHENATGKPGYHVHWQIRGKRSSRFKLETTGGTDKYSYKHLDLRGGEAIRNGERAIQRSDWIGRTKTITVSAEERRAFSAGAVAEDDSEPGSQSTTVDRSDERAERLREKYNGDAYRDVDIMSDRVGDILVLSNRRVVQRTTQDVLEEYTRALEAWVNDSTDISPVELTRKMEDQMTRVHDADKWSAASQSQLILRTMEYVRFWKTRRKGSYRPRDLGLESDDAFTERLRLIDSQDESTIERDQVNLVPKTSSIVIVPTDSRGYQLPDNTQGMNVSWSNAIPEITPEAYDVLARYQMWKVMQRMGMSIGVTPQTYEALGYRMAEDHTWEILHWSNPRLTNSKDSDQRRGFDLSKTGDKKTGRKIRRVGPYNSILEAYEGVRVTQLYVI